MHSNDTVTASIVSHLIAEAWRDTQHLSSDEARVGALLDGLPSIMEKAATLRSIVRQPKLTGQDAIEGFFENAGRTRRVVSVPTAGSGESSGSDAVDDWLGKVAGSRKVVGFPVGRTSEPPDELAADLRKLARLTVKLNARAGIRTSDEVMKAAGGGDQAALDAQANPITNLADFIAAIAEAVRNGEDPTKIPWPPKKLKAPLSLAGNTHEGKSRLPSNLK